MEFSGFSPEAFAVQYDAVVRRDIELFRHEIAAYLGGETSEDQFRACRLRRGVYSQRQAGVMMVRTKIPGGKLTAIQMLELARIADGFAGGKAHLTTRQDVQFYFVPLNQVPELLDLLADVRLTTREAGYNTVRNITACPLAGLCSEEAFDVGPHVRRLAVSLMYNELTNNLPRKFKICFSGCAKDCTLGAIHDIGLRAVVHRQNGFSQLGFRMVAGGGLGPLPTEAQLLYEFVPEESLIAKCVAVLRAFDRYGNRKNKHKARLKFLIRERGYDWFKAAVEKEHADIQQHGSIEEEAGEVPEGFGGERRERVPLETGHLLPVLEPNGAANRELDRWLESNVREQKRPEELAVIVRVDQGNLTAQQMRGLAQITAVAGDGFLRITPCQDVVLAAIRQEGLKWVYLALERIGMEASGAREIEDITACPGTFYCSQALTKPMNLAKTLQDLVKNYENPAVRNLSIKISGCPNACGHHWIADLGFYGNARKIGDKWVPYYQMLLGGGYDKSGTMRFGVAVQSVAARLAPVALKRILDHYVSNRQGGEGFRDYVLRHTVVFFREMTSDLARPAEPFPELFRDWGDEADQADFSLQLGPFGRC